MNEKLLNYDSSVDGIQKARSEIINIICSGHTNYKCDNKETGNCPILNSIDMVLDEVCTNILDHSKANYDRFNILLKMLDDSVSITVSDCKSVKPNKSMKKVNKKYLNKENGNGNRGRGLTVVNESVDRLDIYKVPKSLKDKNGGFVVDMTKNFKQECNG